MRTFIGLTTLLLAFAWATYAVFRDDDEGTEWARLASGVCLGLAAWFAVYVISNGGVEA